MKNHWTLIFIIVYTSTLALILCMNLSGGSGQFKDNQISYRGKRVSQGQGVGAGGEPPFEYIGINQKLPYILINHFNFTNIVNNSGNQELLKGNANEAFHIVVSCRAPYPVKLVYEPNEKEEPTGPIEVSFRNRILYDDEFYNLTYNFHDPSTYIFYLRHTFKFLDVSHDLTFTCQSLEDPCLHQTAIFNFVENNPNHLKINLQNSTDTCPQENIPPDPPANVTDECDATFYYEEAGFDDSNAIYEFRCKFADGSPGRVERFECSIGPKCLNIFRKGIQKKNCWKKFYRTGVECRNCESNRGYNFKAFVAICAKGSERQGTFQETSIGNLAFYGVPQNIMERPAIFFSHDDVIEKEMISLSGFSKSQILGSTINADCHVSGYYASGSFQFALEMEGQDELVLLKPPFNEKGESIQNRTNWIHALGAWDHVLPITLDSLKIKRIYCLANIQDTTQWINASRPVSVMTNANEIETRGDMGESKLVAISSMVASILIVMVVVATTIICLRSRRKNVWDRYRDLTLTEMINFDHGDEVLIAEKNKDELPSIYCLPYDKRFEVERHFITFDPDKIIGIGEFGIVYEGTFTAAPGVKVQVAVKMNREPVNVDNFLGFLSEIKTNAHLATHPNIVSLVAVCTSSMKKRKAIAVLELCENGDLKKFLRLRRSTFKDLFPTYKLPAYCKTSYISNEFMGNMEKMFDDKAKTPLSTLNLLRFAAGIANGMKYLSDKGVIHGDLAIRNILVTAKMEPKISDFGLSSLLLYNSNYVRKTEGKIPWKLRSPESMASGRLTKESDIWSYGICLWEIFSLGQEPYPGLKCGSDFFQRLRAGYRMEMPVYANADVYAIMLDCWNEDPRERPSFSTIYDRILEIIYRLDDQHSYFQLDH